MHNAVRDDSLGQQSIRLFNCFLLPLIADLALSLTPAINQMIAGFGIGLKIGQNFARVSFLM